MRNMRKRIFLDKKKLIKDLNNFKLGLGLSFMLATFGKVIYFLISAYKRNII